MAHDWRASWREGRIGFHEGKPNGYLVQHAARLAGARRVLVPLCGKAEDLAYLASLGHEVVGVELVEDAVRAFFDEHGVTPEVAPRGAYTAYTSGPLTLLAGDLFALDATAAGPVDALYDRAALVAFPPELRPRYVEHLRRLLPSGSRGLVITLEFSSADLAGPPFPVLEPELRSLYAGATVSLVGDGAFSKTRPGLPPLAERCFAITL